MAEKKSHTLLYAAGAAALVLGFAWWKSQQPATTPAGSVAPGAPVASGTNITGISISNGVATPSFTGPNTNMQYALNDQASPMMSSIAPVALPSGLAPGIYHLSMTPYVSVNGQWQPAGSVNGGTASVDFTV